MSAAADWLEQLEARLEQQLEAFLQANPAQEALLRDQERLEHRQHQRQHLQQAEALRSKLLQIAAEIQQWRDRADRARSAGATDLADRADSQVADLMERGRLRWQALEQLGQEVRKSASPAAGPAAANTTRGSNEPLDQAWARFELEQDLETLRRQQRSG